MEEADSSPLRVDVEMWPESALLRLGCINS